MHPLEASLPARSSSPGLGTARSGHVSCDPSDEYQCKPCAATLAGFPAPDRSAACTTAITVAYPVSVSVEPALANRNRLTTAFRLILALPHVILVGGAGLGFAFREGGATTI